MAMTHADALVPFVDDDGNRCLWEAKNYTWSGEIFTYYRLWTWEVQDAIRDEDGGGFCLATSLKLQKSNADMGLDSDWSSFYCENYVTADISATLGGEYIDLGLYARSHVSCGSGKRIKDTARDKLSVFSDGSRHEKAHEAQVLRITASMGCNVSSPALYQHTESVDIEIPARDSYAVCFDANGGSGALPEDQVKWWGEELAIPEAVLGREGYVFCGWSTDAEGEAEFDGVIPADRNEAMTLYAVWDDGVYFVELASGEESEQELVERGSTWWIPGCPFAKAGYDFCGWSLSELGPCSSAEEAAAAVEYAPGQEVMDLASWGQSRVTLHAVWRRDAPVVFALECDRAGDTTGTVQLAFSLYRAGDYDAEDAPKARVRIEAFPRDGIGETAVSFDFEDVGDQGDAEGRWLADPVQQTDAKGELVTVDVGHVTSMDFSEGDFLALRNGHWVNIVSMGVHIGSPPIVRRGTLERKYAYDIGVTVYDPYDRNLKATSWGWIPTGDVTLDFAPGGRAVSLFGRCPDDEGLFVGGLRYDITPEQLEEICTLLGIDAGGG